MDRVPEEADADYAELTFEDFPRLYAALHRDDRPAYDEGLPGRTHVFLASGHGFTIPHIEDKAVPDPLPLP